MKQLALEDFLRLISWAVINIRRATAYEQEQLGLWTSSKDRNAFYATDHSEQKNIYI